MAGMFTGLDYWRWAPELDVVSTDHYLTAADPDNHVGLAFAADLARSLAGGAVAADGALHERGQLAAPQRRQGARAR